MSVVLRSSTSNRSAGESNLDQPSKNSSSKNSSSKILTETASIPEDSTSPIFFWKPDEVPYGRFCQWDLSPFTHRLLTFSLHILPHQQFTSCEQFMMAHKAYLFSPNDTTVYNRILASTSPVEQKALGQQVPNFDEDIWEAHRFEIVKWGNYLKFTQNKELKQLLLGTGDRELVEASPRDWIWGVGFGAKNAEQNRDRWGQNLLGKALMEVRDRIRRKEGEERDGKGRGEVEGKGERA
ncbi:hypothetical protein BGX38DRAFT_1198798 [Terfezia claveryi]|nr:hypothetical protein BGX38DRAFT_1198798 [Terfezia claveryi]